MSNNWLHLLQFMGGTFPTGSFSQSWGLETYLHYDEIKSEEEFRDFLKVYIRDVVGKFEGPFFCEAYNLTSNENYNGLIALERTFEAMRLTEETREASFKTGGAFIRIADEILEDEVVSDYYRNEKSNGISLPVAFALVSSRLKIPKEDALRAFVFSYLNGLVQSGLKLVPLGNAQAQRIMFDFTDIIEKATLNSMGIPIEDVAVFTPGLDIASMRHENLPSRLYMT